VECIKLLDQPRHNLQTCRKKKHCFFAVRLEKIIINCLLYKVNEVEVDQSLGIQSAVMAALLVVGGLDCRPRIGGLVMGEGLGQGEHQQH